VLADDENYSYTFVGWTDGDQTLTADEIEKTATTNRRFVATFQTEEIEKVTKSGWTKLRIAITLIKVALIFIALLIVSIIVVIIVKKKRRAR
jgi:flagellar biosynthesis/type III secretory pathway M-ring protein FliF/YscJ